MNKQTKKAIIKRKNQTKNKGFGKETKTIGKICYHTKKIKHIQTVKKSNINKCLSMINNNKTISDIKKQNEKIVLNNESNDIKKNSRVKTNNSFYELEHKQFFNNHNISVFNTDNKTDLDIKQFLICNGTSRLLKPSTNPNQKPLSLVKDLKIITVRNTNIGITDNIIIHNHLNDTFGFPYKRLIITDRIGNSTNLEIRKNEIFYHNNDIVDNDKKIVLKHKTGKKYLCETFISRIVKVYLLLNESNDNSLPFDYTKYKRLIKTVNGNEFIVILNDLIKIIKYNKNDKILNKYGFCKYNLNHLIHTYNDICLNGFLDYDYNLKRLNRVSCNDKTNIKNDNVKSWNKHKIALMKKQQHKRLKPIKKNCKIPNHLLKHLRK